MIRSILTFVRSKKWLQHLGFWLGYIVFFSLLYTFSYAAQNTIEELKKHFINLLVGLPSFVFATYVIAYRVIPLMFFRRKTVIGIFILIIVLSIASVSDILLSYLFLYHLTFGIAFNELTTINWQLYLINLPWISYPVVIFSSIKYVKDHYEAKVEREEAKRKSAEYEHRKLLRQLNPHFLFNNLNNLYQLTLDKSDKASVMVEKISAIFHYVLHESYERFVSLAKETNFIKNYLELVDIRYEGFVETNLEIEGDLHSFRIIPMVLYNIVDNNMNNGTLQSTDKPSILVSIKTMEDAIYFTVETSLEDHQKENIASISDGLEEIRTHLKQLYGNKFILQTKVQPNRFITFMELKNVNLP